MTGTKSINQIKTKLYFKREIGRRRMLRSGTGVPRAPVIMEAKRWARNWNYLAWGQGVGAGSASETLTRPRFSRPGDGGPERNSAPATQAEAELAPDPWPAGVLPPPAGTQLNEKRQLKWRGFKGKPEREALNFRVVNLSLFLFIVSAFNIML